MKYPGRKAGIVGMLAILMTGVAQADPVFFEQLSAKPNVFGGPLTGRNAFEGGLTGIQRVDFDSLATGGRPDALSFQGDGNSPTAATLALAGFCINSNNACKIAATSSTASVGRYNTTRAPETVAGQTGTAGKWWEADGSFTLTFASAVQAFGFYGTDFGDLNGQLTIELLRGSSTTGELKVNHTQGLTSAGALVFWGISDTLGYDTIKFRITQSNTSLDDYDSFGFDDLLIGNLRPAAVPEPASLALVGLSLAALAASRRRKPDSV